MTLHDPSLLGEGDSIRKYRDHWQYYIALILISVYIFEYVTLYDNTFRIIYNTNSRLVYPDIKIPHIVKVHKPSDWPQSYDIIRLVEIYPEVGLEMPILGCIRLYCRCPSHVHQQSRVIPGNIGSPTMRILGFAAPDSRCSPK